MKENHHYIEKLYIGALFPNVAAVLGGTVNVFFDGIFVGQKLGSAGLESVNQSLPMYLLLCMIGSLFASGASVLSSHAMGKNDVEESARIFHGALLDSLVAGGIFCALGFFLTGQFASLLSTPQTYDYVCTYVRITMAGGLFKVLLYLPYFYLRLEGRHKQSMTAMLLMTVTNIVLDYVFLFVFDWGIAGAAWASVIATVLACVLSFYFLWRGGGNFSPGFSILTGTDRLAIAKYGAPMAVNNLLSSARICVLNMILCSVGASGLLSVFAVINNVNEFSICIQNGVPQTAGAMAGIFYGEKDDEGLKNLLRLQLLAGTILSVVFAVFLIACSEGIGYLFGSTEDCRGAAACFGVSLLFATASSVMTNYYNVIGEVWLSEFIIVCRGFAAVVFFAAVFRRLGNLIWLFYPCAEAATFVLMLAAGAWRAKQRGRTFFYLLDAGFEQAERSVSFVVPCTNEEICGASEKIRGFCEENGFSAKETMVVSLALEELMTVIADKSCPPDGVIDVRVLKSGEDKILRLRSGGKKYNPVEEQDGSLDYMGVKMIGNLAKRIEYLSALGLNTLTIQI